jgi:hypothetical protein
LLKQTSDQIELARGQPLPPLFLWSYESCVSSKSFCIERISLDLHQLVSAVHQLVHESEKVAGTFATSLGKPSDQGSPFPAVPHTRSDPTLRNPAK